MSTTTAAIDVAGHWRARARWSFVFVRNLFALIGVAVVVSRCCFFTLQVTSPSMHPTLQGTSWGNGDWILCDKLTFRVRQPRRWEVVAIRHDAGDAIAKRVVGLPGETIQILKDRRIVIDGRPITKPPFLRDIQYFPYGNVIYDQAYPCAGGYYVLGDDSKDSDDSRFNGTVAPERILGRVRLVIWPLNRIGWVAP